MNNIEKLWLVKYAKTTITEGPLGAGGGGALAGGLLGGGVGAGAGSLYYLLKLLLGAGGDSSLLTHALTGGGIGGGLGALGGYFGGKSQLEDWKEKYPDAEVKQAGNYGMFLKQARGLEDLLVALARPAAAAGAAGAGAGAIMAPEQLMRIYPAGFGAVGGMGAGVGLLGLLSLLTRQRHWMGKTRHTKFKTFPNHQLLDRAMPSTMGVSTLAGAGAGALAPELLNANKTQWPYGKLF